MRSKIFTRTVGYWPLQESSGQALDYSGNENHATSTNVSSYGVSGPLGGTSMNFDGSYNGVSTPWGSGYSGEITISAWVKPVHEDDIMVIVDSYNGDERLLNLWIRGSTSGDPLSCSRYNGSSHTSFPSADVIKFGEWQHVASTWDGETTKLYHNGVKVGSETDTSSITNDANYVIGNAPNSSQNGFKGEIAHVRIWNYPLSEASIRSSYNASKGGFSESSRKTL